MSSPTYVCELTGSPKLKLWLSKYNDTMVNGQLAKGPWQLVVGKLNEVGDWVPLEDFVEWEYNEMLKYVDRFVSRDSVWRSDETDEIKDIYVEDSVAG